MNFQIELMRVVVLQMRVVVPPELIEGCRNRWKCLGAAQRRNNIVDCLIRLTDDVEGKGKRGVGRPGEQPVSDTLDGGRKVVVDQRVSASYHDGVRGLVGKAKARAEISVDGIRTQVRIRRHRNMRGQDCVIFRGRRRDAWRKNSAGSVAGRRQLATRDNPVAVARIKHCGRRSIQQMG